PRLEGRAAGAASSRSRGHEHDTHRSVEPRDVAVGCEPSGARIHAEHCDAGAFLIGDGQPLTGGVECKVTGRLAARADVLNALERAVCRIDREDGEAVVATVRDV